MAVSMETFMSDVNKDIKALNATILMLSQKMIALVRNEKILGRNLLVLNKKIKDLQDQIAMKVEAGAPGGPPSEELQSKLNELKTQLDENTKSISDLRELLEKTRAEIPKTEEIKELQYVIDTINPLEFITFKQVDEIIERKLKEKLGK